jgi:hypothetical protein
MGYAEVLHPEAYVREIVATWETTTEVNQLSSQLQAPSDSSRSRIAWDYDSCPPF